MPDQAAIERFISSTFRSVWDLELLLELRREHDQSQSKETLVSTLRASDIVVAKGIDTLLAAGLIAIEADGSIRYAPASRELADMVAGAVDLYRSKPDTVRRHIVHASSSGLAAFSDAFRLKGDK
jgi:hypothetical protein